MEDLKCKKHPPILFFIFVILALVFIDLLHLGPLGDHDYKPVKTKVAPYRHVMDDWPTDNRSRLQGSKLEFVNSVYGPESIDFDLDGHGPYTGLADGRIVRWAGYNIGWETFAVVSRNWSKNCAIGAESTTWKQHANEERCGRPLGIRFDRQTGNLYVADAYHGLQVIPRTGGFAVPLATHVQGKPILFANDLDIHRNGSVFFTDTSTRYTRRNNFLSLLEGEATGRLLMYNPSTKKTHAVLNELHFPNGVQISEDQTYVLFAETSNCRLMRYWLEGKKQGKVEVFANLPGFPDNVRMNQKGQYWVAVDCCRTPTQEILTHNPWLLTLYFKLPLRMKSLVKLIGMEMYSVISLFDDKGRVIDVLEDRRGQVVKLVSEVREVDGKLWIGTVAHNHIATLNYP